MRISFFFLQFNNILIGSEEQLSSKNSSLSIIFKGQNNGRWLNKEQSLII